MDKYETEIDLAYSVNITRPKKLASAANQIGEEIVHVSTVSIYYSTIFQSVF